MRRSLRSLLAATVAAALVLPLWGATAANAEPPGYSHADKDTLRNQAPRDLAIGSAVWGKRDLVDYDRSAPTEYQQVLSAQFSSLTPENDMKWDAVHPAPDVYDFSSADALVAFAQANHQQVRGHTLLWHSQNPAWVTAASQTWTCDQARAVLEDHIRTVVGHFKGEIYEWDVANEIFQDTWDNGGVRLRTEANPFLKACAADPIALLEDAFRWAHDADPEAVLFLNDYNAEGINEKTDAYYALAQRMLADGVPLGGFGAQGHLSLLYGFDTSIQANFERFAALGLQVAVTEADVRIPLQAGETGPTPEQVAVQAERYDATLTACLNVTACSSFTVWGFPDANSWVPDVFPGEGWATILEDDYSPKPAFDAMLESLREATPGTSPRHG
ncbi:MAG TPA: endo-1,4-beta-xylanase [Microbacterium sp.]|uniref:endo-1,4-beta-xylanase n=1 Tax=Microbacterium sp. TaxID=51671 RepID=UPI002F922A1F